MAISDRLRDELLHALGSPENRNEIAAILNSTSGTNSGDVTLTAVGSSPSANGASLSGQALTLQPADATHPGAMTSGSQTIGGAKTFSTSITSPIMIASSYAKVSGITQAARDLLTASAGMIIFNTDTSKHQGYDGTVWNDLY